MQFLACILKAVVPVAILPRAYHGIGYNPFGFVALVISCFC